jgi:hypothetical protein
LNPISLIGSILSTADGTISGHCGVTGFRHWRIGLITLLEDHWMANLEQVAQSLWIGEGGIVDFYGFAYPTRCVIVRLDSGALWVWSPVELTERLRREVEALGPIRHLVSPNKLHHPGASLWGPALTIRRHTKWTFQPQLDDHPPSAWIGEIDQAWFRGSIYMDEIAFFHRSSRTAIVADLIQTFTDDFLRAHWRPWQRPLAASGGIVAAKAQAPLDWRLSFLNRKPARAARDKVLRWDCERVIVARGAWQRSDGSSFMRGSLSWLGGEIEQVSQERGCGPFVMGG